MRDIVKEYLDRKKDQNKRNKRQIVRVILMAFVVAIGSFYGLRYSGFTLTEPPVLTCEKEEHVHSLNCYTDTLICDLEETKIIHTHDEHCYDAEGNHIICNLPEVKEHTHDESCYDEQGNLVCGQEEIRAHVHTDTCFDEFGNLICTEKEIYSHQHTDECNVGTETVQSLAEALQIPNAHFHTQECYEEQVVCGKEAHIHSQTCYSDAVEEEQAEAAEDIEVSEPEEEDTNTLSTLDMSSFFNDFTPLSEEQIAVSLVQNEGEVDFGNWITGVDLQKEAGWENWAPADPNDIKLNDKLRFKVDYIVPVGLLPSDGLVSYSIPDGITISNQGKMTGDVTNSSGQKVGTYSIENNKIKVQFTPEMISQNKTSTIEAFVSFEGKVEASDYDEKGDKDITFSESVKLHLHTEEKKITTEDLKTKKEVTNVDEATGTITYKIKVTSQNGTASSVELNDVMNDLKLDGDIVVEPNDDAAVAKTADGFSVTLPQMTAGKTYFLTYTAKADLSAINGLKTVNNKVTVDSKRNDGAKLHDEQEVKTEIHHEVLNKVGKLENGKMKWTITINAAKQDISGWTLSDKLNDIPFEGTVNIAPAINGQSQITLPYTFPQGSNEAYTITYETNPEKKMGIDQAINTAILTPSDNKPPFTKDAWGWIGNGSFIPLDKVAEKNDVSDQSPDKDGNITLTWKLTVDATQGTIPAGWILEDELDNGQWYTYDQMNAFLNPFKDLEYTAEYWEINPNGETGAKVQNLEQGKKYKRIKLTFNNNLPMGKKIEFTYCSTAAAPTLGSSTYFNSAKLNGQFEHKPQITYESKNKIPTVQKVDANSEQTGNTTHNISENINPAWYIKLNIPAGYSGSAITVKEKLPNEVEMTSLSYKENNEWIQIKKNTPNDISYEKDENHSDIEIKIPEEFVKNDTQYDKEIMIKIEVKIADDAQWNSVSNGSEQLKLKNEVEVRDGNNKELHSDSQEQTFERKKEEPAISKSAGTVTDNIIPYFLVVNPDGKDLVPGADTLTLVDEMKYQPWNGVWFSASLVPGSLHIYERNEDGTQGRELTLAEYTEKYEESEDASDQYSPPKYSRNLTIEIPDGKPLMIRYNYLIRGTLNQWPNFANTATLQGYSGSGNSDNKSTQVHIQQSSAGADSSAITVTLAKVDSKNNNLMLSGAHFKLEKFENENWSPVNENIETTSNGTVEIKDLTYNTAYRLIETKAPDGYQLDSAPYEFYLKNDDKKSYPESKPSDFKGKMRYNGDTIYRTNEQSSTSISIQKKWEDANGESFTPQASSIIIQLQRKLNSDGTWENYGNPFELTASNNWKIELNELEAKKYDANGNEEGTYLYRIQEVNVDSGFKVTYSENNQNGIASGTITITNKKVDNVVLPETGGSGTRSYTFIGVLFVLAGSIITLYKRRFHLRN